MRTEDLQNAYPNPPEDFHNAVLSSLYKLDAQSPVRYKKRRVMRVAVVCAIVAALGSFTVVAAATNFFGLFSEPVGKFGLHVGVTEEATASTSDSLKAVKMKFGYMTEGFEALPNMSSHVSKFQNINAENGECFSFSVVPAKDFDYTETYIIDSEETVVNGHKLIITTRQMTEGGEVDYGATMYFEDWGYVVGGGAYGGADKNELLKMGYTCPMDIRPILIKFEDYKQTPDEATIKKYSDGKKNLVFVGRIAPNKKQENVIRAFYCYKKLNPDSRLILVGSSTGMENYYERLVKYANALGIGDDVIFPGHIKFSEILAYYRLADAFVCMSEHEGFCVPLVEAMFFDTPIIAYDTSAISDTLGGSGVLLDNNDPVFAAAVIDRVLTDEKFRESIIAGQRKRLEDFSYERIKAIFEKELTDFINGKKATE